MVGGENMKKKLNKFFEALEDYGEYYFSYGNVKEDYDFITSILKAQGYWAGNSYRFYFDNDFNLLSVEDRF